MGDYMCSDEELKAYIWCIHNSIYIAPKAKSSSSWYLTIEINKKINVSPDSYGKVEIWKQMYKYYIYYYEKYKK